MQLANTSSISYSLKLQGRSEHFALFSTLHEKCPTAIVEVGWERNLRWSRIALLWFSEGAERLLDIYNFSCVGARTTYSRERHFSKSSSRPNHSSWRYHSTSDYIAVGFDKLLLIQSNNTKNFRYYLALVNFILPVYFNQRLPLVGFLALSCLQPC